MWRRFFVKKEKGKKEEEDICKGVNAHHFIMEVHHGGEFINSPKKVYVEGKVDYVYDCNLDKWSLEALDNVAKKLGYSEPVGWNFRISGLSLKAGLIFCMTDRDCVTMVNTLPPNKVADVYITHQGGFKMLDMGNNENGTEIEIGKKVPAVEGQDNMNVGKSVDSGHGVDIEVEKEDPVDTENCEVRKQTNVSSGIGHNGDECLHDINVDYNYNTESDPTYNADFIDSDYEMDENDDALFDECVVDETSEMNENSVNASADNISFDGGQECPTEIMNDPDLINVDDMHFEYDATSSDDLKSISDSEDDGTSIREKRPRYPVFNEKTDLKKPVFKIGLRFSSSKVFRSAIRMHAIVDDRDIKLTKNESGRIRAKCCEGCKWRISSSLMHDRKTIQVKRFDEPHTCERVWKNKNMTSKFTAELYMLDFKRTPSMTVAEFAAKINEELNVDFSLKQAYRARQKILQKIEGSYAEQYAKLEDYCGELRKVNPGSTVILETALDEEGQNWFNRLYICLEPLKRGFLGGCRKLIGLDGCHLKGPHGGQLLTAVGIYRSREKVDDYLDSCYTKSTYMRSYEPVLNPVSGLALWEKTGMPIIVPPNYGKTLRRPKKCRKRQLDEDPVKRTYANPAKLNMLSKKGGKVRCGHCKLYAGHNKLTCPTRAREKEVQQSQQYGAGIGSEVGVQALRAGEKGTSDQVVDAGVYGDARSETNVQGVGSEEASDKGMEGENILYKDVPMQDAKETGGAIENVVTKRKRKCGACRKYANHNKARCPHRLINYGPIIIESIYGDNNRVPKSGHATAKNARASNNNEVSSATNGHAADSAVTTNTFFQVKHASTPLVYSFGPGITVRAPVPHIPLLPGPYQQVNTVTVGKNQLAPASFVWNGKKCINLSTLQTAAGHNQAHSSGVMNVQMYEKGGKVVKKGKGSVAGTKP